MSCPLCGNRLTRTERNSMVFLALVVTMIAAIVLAAGYSAGALTVVMIQS